MGRIDGDMVFGSGKMGFMHKYRAVIGLQIRLKRRFVNGGVNRELIGHCCSRNTGIWRRIGITGMIAISARSGG